MAKQVKASKQKNEMTRAADLTLEYQNNMREILEGTEFAPVLASVLASSGTLLKKFNHLSGKAPVTEAAEQFPPITNFMGEDIKTPTKVAKEDLTPVEAEKQDYLGRVQSLQDQFPSLDDQGIINGHTTNEDKLVLRGVAKRAGLEDYETGEINARFIERTRTGLIEKAAEATQQREIDRNLALKNAGASQEGATPLAGGNTQEGNASSSSQPLVDNTNHPEIKK